MTRKAEIDFVGAPTHNTPPSCISTGTRWGSVGKIKDFPFPWNKAFKDSKFEHKLFHDLRHTAVRNMIREGVPEKVAMRISGHKTRSVFERYNIVDDKDLKLATAQQEKYFESVVGTISGTIVDFNTKKPLGRTQEASM